MNYIEEIFGDIPKQISDSIPGDMGPRIIVGIAVILVVFIAAKVLNSKNSESE